MRILIIGGSGQIGKHLDKDLRKLLTPSATVLSTYYANRIEPGLYIDITSAEDLKSCISITKPNKIIWLAGSKNVQLLEKEPHMSLIMNEAPIRNLLNILGAMAVPPDLIYVSSDYVFCGQKGSYRDTDERHPTTIYGRSKKLVEDMITQSGLNCIVLRTSAVMSQNGGFLAWFLGELKEERQVSLFNNTFFSPTPPLFLSRAIQLILEEKLDQKILNFAGPKTTRLEIGLHLSREFGFGTDLIKSETADLSTTTFHPDFSLITSSELSHLAPKTLTAFSPETCT